MVNETTPRRGLLLVAHGSEREESNREVRNLARSLAPMAAGRFGLVTCGFLRTAQPTFETAIEQCVHKGAREIVIVPYFLAEGTHVNADIPRAVEAKRRQHPGVVFAVARHVGGAAGMGRLILSVADSTVLVR